MEKQKRKEVVNRMPKTTDLPGIGDRLRQAREAAGLSQGQVARLMNMHRPTVTEIENEARKVSAGELKQFATLYHVSVEWLMGDTLNANDKIKLAARKLHGLKESDLQTVMRIIDSFRREGSDR
jgi:transcriptional regulator with XRE-family HTH domain